MTNEDIVRLLGTGRPVLLVHFTETSADRKLQDFLNKHGIEYTTKRVSNPEGLRLPQLCIPLDEKSEGTRKLLDTFVEEEKKRRPMEGQDSLPLIETAA